MSLTDFMNQPEIKAAYKEYAVRPKLPFDTKNLEIEVESGENASSVGTAFDYMARFLLTRDLVAMGRDNPERDVDIIDTGWVAETAVEHMGNDHRFGRYFDRWVKILTRSRELFQQFIEGEEADLDKVATCCQFLGNVDLLVRIDGFNPNFKPRDNVQEELIALSRVFNPIEHLKPREMVILNPVFTAQHAVDGADGDLIVDNAIIDFKSTKKIGVSSDHIRQMLGYKVLHDMMVERGGREERAGIFLGDGEPVWAGDIDEVGVYFARFGRLAKWRVDEIMPDGGFERFSAICRQHMKPVPGLTMPGMSR